MRPTLMLLLAACQNPPTESADFAITAKPPAATDDTGTDQTGVDDTGNGDSPPESPPPIDNDGDGYDVTVDCDDADADTWPGAPEVCYDGVDQNCDALPDLDCDGDGADSDAFGGDDCDDADSTVYVGAAELDDLKDQDCDGLVDEDAVSAGDLVLTELMVDPTTGAIGEWVEIHNRSARSIELKGWSLEADDGESWPISDSLVVAPGGYVVLGASTDRSANGGAAVDLAWSGFSLSDLVDVVSVRMAGLTITEVSYDESWTFVAGISLGLDPLLLDPALVDDPSAWCSGASRYGDGDYGTPGAPNDACTTLDHDGDGYSVDDGDCDDADSLTWPGAIELWDGADNDCDGVADQVGTDAALGWVDGEGSDDLGYEAALGTGDTDGDGEPEIFIGGRHLESSSTGGVYGLHADDLLTTGDAEDLAFTVVLGDDYYNYAGAISPRLGDSDGDGLDDLVIGASDYYASTYPDNVAGAFISGVSLGGALTVGQGTTTFSGAGFTNLFVTSNLDIDGDGLADALIGDPYAQDALTAQGRACVLTAATLTAGGTVDFADADQVLVGEDDYDYFGFSSAGGDLDGDGYDELLIAAYGSDLGVEEGGVLYIVAGSSAGASGSIADVQSAVITGDVVDAHIGVVTPALVHDLDGNGTLDVALSARFEGKAWVFLDSSVLTGTLSTADATAEVDGGPEDYFGTGLSAGDVDGDGIPELLIGAADSYTTQIEPDQPGMVYGWSGDRIAGGSLDALNADFAITGGLDLFGFVITAADLDADGDDELLIAAPFYNSTRAGRLYLFGR